MKNHLLSYAVLALLFSGSVSAEAVIWRCSYTETTYDAAFMSQPETRRCPEGLCAYEIRFDSERNQATINGVDGYRIEKSPTTLVFSRSAENPIMGGVDTAQFTINVADMTFEGRKTTTPSVTVTTQGACVAP